MSDKAQVALVNMPFSYSKFPSIQLGTLSALLKSNGVPVDCNHLNVRFDHKVGVSLYEMIYEKQALFGKWIFPHLLFRDNLKRTEYPRLLSRCSSNYPRRAAIRPHSSKTWRREQCHSFWHEL